MEISVVRQRLNQTMEHARRTAAERRTAADAAARAYEPFLSQIAVPLMRQIASVLKAAKLPFSVNTPAGAVRLSSDRNAEDFIELSLDSSGSRPLVVCHTSRARGRRVIEHEQPVSDADIHAITEDELFDVLLQALEPFVER